MGQVGGGNPHIHLGVGLRVYPISQLWGERGGSRSSQQTPAPGLQIRSIRWIEDMERPFRPPAPERHKSARADYCRQRERNRRRPACSEAFPVLQYDSADNCDSFPVWRHIQKIHIFCPLLSKFTEKGTAAAAAVTFPDGQ